MEVKNDNGTAVIGLPELFSGPVVKEFSGLARGVLKEKEPKLVIDFSETEMIDSTAIGSLVSLAKEFKAKDADLTLRNLSEEVEDLFVDTSLDKIFNMEKASGLQSATVDLFEISAEIKLEIDQEVRDDILVFHLKGLMNHPVGTRLFKQQFLLALADYKKVLLDFEELTFFDSLSVSVVLTMNKLLKKTGGSLRICGANCIVDDLFTTLNIDQIVPFFDNVDEAVRDWVITA